MSETFVIIGAGQAGCQAAATLRSEHFTGDIVMIGDEAQPPYQRPPLSKKYLMGELAAPRLELRPRKFYDDQNVTLKLATRALSIDTRAHRITLSDGTSQPYTKVLLATGTRARPLAIPGAQAFQGQQVRFDHAVQGPQAHHDRDEQPHGAAQPQRFDGPQGMKPHQRHDGTAQHKCGDQPESDGVKAPGRPPHDVYPPMVACVGPYGGLLSCIAPCLSISQRLSTHRRV